MTMTRNLVKPVRRLLRAAGFDVVRLNHTAEEFEPWIADIVRTVSPYTMTSSVRIAALCEATAYVVQNRIPGDIVECGVWKGGSMMAVALTLLRLEDTARNLYLFDTFEGMPVPSDADRTPDGRSAADLMQSEDKSDPTSVWCVAPLDEVRQALHSVAYDESKIHFVKGRVEETIPARAPASIALLRLDTDWYASTRHELEHLYPRLSVGGVLVIDDYGHWEGARRAVDEYVREKKIPLLLQRIDYSGRRAVKVR